MDEAMKKMFEKIADANPVPIPKSLLDKRQRRVLRALKRERDNTPRPDLESPHLHTPEAYFARRKETRQRIADLCKRSVAR